GKVCWWHRCSAGALLLMVCCSESRSAESEKPSADTGGGGGQPQMQCRELELRLGEFTEEGQALAPLSDGDPLHLWNAPQGGHVVLVGAEARGFTGELGSIEARL